jgi:hypothetical protein
MITLVKMDGAANDSPLDSISWDGFPSLFYIKAGSKTIIPYTGGRDAGGILKFIATHHSKKDQISAKLTAGLEEVFADDHAGHDHHDDEDEEGEEL